MPTISESLRMLRDVEGVHGSFVVATSGSLVDSDLPAVFDSELLGEVGSRVARLYETFFSGGGDMETCVLRYAEHKLYVRKMTWGIIGVLSSVAINLPALRMVANLVIRRIDPEIAAISLTPSSTAKTLPSPAKQPASQRTAADPMASALMPSLPVHDPLPVIPEDGRDGATVPSERHVHMYRGRLVDD
jgi:predicted regulator of Ras-like GTPase activity (Roadblock/LC7/MglB family)